MLYLYNNIRRNHLLYISIYFHHTKANITTNINVKLFINKSFSINHQYKSSHQLGLHHIETTIQDVHVKINHTNSFPLMQYGYPIL